MGRERVLLHLEVGVRRVRRWRSAGSSSSRCRFVTIGQLAGGRWFADHTGEDGAVLCRDQVHAEQMAAAWTVDGWWLETPAVFDAQSRPVPPERWRKAGGEWLPAADPPD
jgi:hypothetical protein